MENQPGWASRDVVEAVVSKLGQKDVAALRWVSRGLRANIDGVCSSLAPTVLHLVPGKFEALKALDLSRLCRPIAESEVAATLSQLQGLTALVMGGQGCSQLRSTALAPVGGLTRLRCLAVLGCRKVRWSVLSSWHDLRLSSLALVGLACSASDAGALAEMLEAGCGAGLTRLVLGDARSLSFVPDAAIGAALRACSPSSLRSLDLSGCLELTDAGATPIAALTALEDINLHNCLKLGDAAIAAVSRLPALRSLSLRGCSQLGDHHVAALASVGTLQSLSLQSCNGINGACLLALTRGGHALASINLSHCMRLEERHLAALESLPALRRLDLTGCQAAAAAGIGCLSGLSALTLLRASGWTQLPQLQSQRRRMRQHAEQERQGQLARSSSEGALAALAALVAGCVEGGTEWRVPSQVVRLDLRGATLTAGALQQLLAGLPAGLQALDLSQATLIADDGDVAAPSGVNGNTPAAAGGLNTAAAGAALDGVDEQQGPAPTGAGAAASELQLSVADVIPLSSLTALTSLSLSGVGRDSEETSTEGSCSEEDGGGVGDSGDEYEKLPVQMIWQERLGLQTCGSGGSSSLGSSSAGAPRSGSCGSSDGGAAGSFPGTAWRPGGLEALGRLGAMQHGGIRKRASSSLSASSARRALDLDAWATRDPAPLQLGGAHTLRLQRLLGAAVGCEDAVCDSGDESGGPVANTTAGVPSFAAFSWGRQGDCGSCSSSGSEGTSWPGACSPVVLTFSEAGGGSPARGAVAHLTAGNGPTRPPARLRRSTAPILAAPAPSWLSPLVLLQRLSLTRSSWLTDAAVASLAALTALRSLDVSGCRALTGAGFAALTALTALSELSCSACTALSDSGVAAVVGALHGSLRRVDLSACEGVGDGGAACLGAVTGLTALSLAGNRTIGSRTASALSQLRHLRRLDLALCCGLDDSALTHLAVAPALAELDVRACWRLSEEGVCHLLSTSTSLVSLNVEGCHRLFGTGGNVPEGFECHHQRRPGIIARLPPRSIAPKAVAVVSVGQETVTAFDCDSSGVEDIGGAETTAMPMSP